MRPEPCGSGRTFLFALSRRRLIETVLAYVGTGSVSLAAQRLYCYRNSVLHRRARVHQLTGYDPAIPAAAATLAPALNCRPRPGHTTARTGS
ncbi:helix-turn-helix domain-containing protein [Arthrobacter yangruifuii]|uniref:helix-turn-helix domain-containing protein n=1 Tax=Arthrobacter yangruifuii TaxID=2606616 RepID=UPI003CCC9937